MARVLAVQSGGCTAVINNSLVGVIEEARAVGVEEIYGARFGVRGLLGADFMDLGRQDRAMLGLKARFDKPGMMQRMSISLVSETDGQEADLVGRAGMRAALDGASGVMVTLVRLPGDAYHCTTGLAPVEKIAN